MRYAARNTKRTARMDSNAWARKVEAARTADEVVSLVREYVATRDSRDLALLPAHCPPPRLFTAEEIADCAYRMAAYHGHDDTARVIQRIGSVLSRAAVRLAELSRS